MRAREIMTPQVITVGPDTSVVEAIDTMLRHHVSGLPVVDTEGRLVGIISEGDFIRRAETGTQHARGRWLRFLVGADKIAAEFVHEHGRKVGEIMTSHPLTVTEDTPLDAIAQIMESNGIKRLPVLQGSRLVGIVTRSDFLATLAGLAHSLPAPSADDDQIRSEVRVAMAKGPGRPCRLHVTVRDGIVSLGGIVRKESARQASVVAAENVAGVRKVHDNLWMAPAHPPPEEDFGGGDFVSLQEEPSTTDDEPL